MIFFSKDLDLQNKFKKKIISLMDQYTISLKSINSKTLLFSDIMLVLNCENNNFEENIFRFKDLFDEISNLIIDIGKMPNVDIYDLILIISRDEYIDKDNIISNLFHLRSKQLPIVFHKLYRKIARLYELLDDSIEQPSEIEDDYYKDTDLKINEEELFDKGYILK